MSDPLVGDRQPFGLPIGKRPENPALAYTAGATEPWTVHLMQAYIVAAEPKVVIETGSFSGETTIALGEALASVEGIALLYTVEADAARSAHVKQLMENRPFIGVGVNVVHSDALEFLRSVPAESVDMIFLDDDHKQPHVRQELLEARRILRPGGVCFVHDVMAVFNLAPAIREFGGVCLSLRRWHPSGGLGIIVK
jgi:predicted O-methyltransferase YrrM